MQTQNLWQRAFRALLAFILILNLGGFDCQVGTGGGVTDGGNEGGNEEMGQPPPPMTEPSVPTTGDSNPDPTANPTVPTTTMATDPFGTTGDETGTTTAGETGEPEAVCGNNGVRFKNKLSMPICYEDLLMVTEGWIYSLLEQMIHGNECHKAVDIAAPYGAEVRLETGGWCLATFESSPTLSKQNTKIGAGGGLLVVCLHEGWANEGIKGFYTQKLHLSGLDGLLEDTYFDPVYQMTEEGWDSWVPEVILQDVDGFLKYATVYIEEGELIGYVGVSGLSADGNDPPSPNPEMVVSWDEPHLHDQVHDFRVWDEDLQLWKRPPTGIYDISNVYWYADDYWSFAEWCEGMIACDPDLAPFPLYPWQCDGVPANGAVYRNESRSVQPKTFKLKTRPQGIDWTLRGVEPIHLKLAG